MNKFERRVEELNSIAKKSMEIRGIFLSGSLANGTFDSYSDIDLRFLIETKELKKSIIEFYTLNLVVSIMLLLLISKIFLRLMCFSIPKKC